MRAAHWCSSDPHSRKPESRRPQTSQVDRNNEPERRSEATPPSDIKGASPLYRGRTPYQRSRSSQRGPSRGLPIRSDLNGNSGSPTAEEAPEEARVPLRLRNLFRTVRAIAPLRSGNHRTHRVNVLALHFTGLHMLFSLVSRTLVRRCSILSNPSPDSARLLRSSASPSRASD